MGQTMSDLIDRKDAIKALRLEYPMMPLFKSLRVEWVIKTEGYRKAEEVIMSLPAVDAIERKRGVWERYPCCNEVGAVIHRCSECGATVSFVTPYCPICGADMREREGE